MKRQIIPLDIGMCYGDTNELIHPVLIQDEHNCILVDCGFVGSLALIEAQLEQHGVKAAQVTKMVLTHHDHDHMGAAAAFKQKYPAVQIYASKQESAYISASETPLRLIQAEKLQELLPPSQQAFGRAFCALLRAVGPVNVDVLLQDGACFDWCGGCKIIATPGHTPGHISLYMTEFDLIIAGDAIALEHGSPAIANPQFTLDMDGARASMAKLLDMNPACILCYHGGMYSMSPSPQHNQ